MNNKQVVSKALKAVQKVKDEVDSKYRDYLRIGAFLKKHGFDFRTNTLLQVPKLREATGKLKECIDKLKEESKLTEFERKVSKIIEIVIHDGTKSLEPDTVRYFAFRILSDARKQIASEIDIDAIWGELVCRGVERLSRADVEEFVERLKEGKYEKRTD